MKFLRSNYKSGRLPVVVAVFLATVVGTAFRFWGLHWGAPARVDLHPDEIDYVMHHAIGLMHRIEYAWAHPADFNRLTLDPIFLNYPGLLMYLIAFTSAILHGFGFVGETWEVYMVGRTITALFGVATIPAVAWLAAELGASRKGIALSALWMALFPLHVWEGHAAITDIPMTFFTTLTLVAAVRLLTRDRWRDYLFAGVSLGLSVASKYTAAIAVVAILLGIVLSRRPLKSMAVKTIVCGAVSVLVCFLTTPYSFIRFHDLLAAMQYEHTHTLSHHYGFSVYACGWWFRRWIYQVVAAWPFSLGFALYFCCVAGGLWVLRNLSRGWAVLLGFAAVFFYVTGSWTFTPLRYYLPILVVAVLLAARWQAAWIESASRLRRALATTSILIAAAYTALFTYETTARYSHETRIAAGQWIDANVPPNSTIIYCGWVRYFGEAADASRYKQRFTDERILGKLSEEAQYDVVAISSLLYERHYRHGNYIYINAYDRLRDPNGAFEQIARFESHFVNKKLYMKLDPMFEGYFVSPTIEYYRAKAKRQAAG